MVWALPYFDYLVSYGGISHVGMVRPNNEDAWLADTTYGLFAVADGVGGHAAGEVAARLAVRHVSVALQSPAAHETLQAYLREPIVENRASVFALLEQAVQGANAEVLTRQKENPAERNMACTLDVALLLGTHAFIVHAGDSRVYLARPATVMQITTDHTLHAGLLQKGAATLSEPPRGESRLLNGIGLREQMKPDQVVMELAAGDRLLLCSDGVHREIGDEKELGELVRYGRPQEAVLMVVNEALQRGGHDNTTAIVIDVGEQRVSPPRADNGQAAHDHALASHCPIFLGMDEELVTLGLQSSIEVSFDAGAELPRQIANDRVAYVVLSGSVTTPQGWTVGPSAIVYPESLVNAGRNKNLCTADLPTRALRIRGDDFREVCATNEGLAAGVYERLARQLARTLG